MFNTHILLLYVSSAFWILQLILVLD